MSEHAEPKNEKLPSKAALATLDTLEAELETDAAERSRMQREAKRKLIDKHRIHPEAFALTRRLKSMEPVDRNAYLRHFLHYVESFGLDKQLDFFEVPLAEAVASMSQAGHREGLGNSRGNT